MLKVVYDIVDIKFDDDEEKYYVEFKIAGVSEDEAKAISDAALDYAVARIRALPLVGKTAR